jgi:predicted ABC-class ATPase
MDALRRTLRRIDGRGYKAYHDAAGSYEDGDVTLFVDHVQGDPFAAPSRVRVRLAAAWPQGLHEGRPRHVALRDWLARRTARAIEADVGGRRGSGKSGLVAIDAGGQEVLERSAAALTPEWAEARLAVGLPAAGRRVLGREAERLLCDELPALARRALAPGDETEAETFVACVENQEAVRSALDERALVAFVAEGAVLPRASGVSQRPLRGAVPFETPDALRVELELPNAPHRLVGMGLPRGVTLVVGGGYHGKSTLLRALQRGVYPHVPGDGREGVVTDPHAVKVRAEDGRRVARVDISPFIGDLPGGAPTDAFESDDASGSTSQAASIMEAVEAGARVLLMDEDTCATNFMIRDARMQELVAAEDEPITPFVDRVRELWETLGVSSVVVMGGSGDYFEVADTVLAMQAYRPRVVTERAREIAAARRTGRERQVRRALTAPSERIPDRRSLDPSKGRRDVKIDARARDEIGFGRETIDLRGVEQLVDRSQTRAVGLALERLRARHLDGKTTLGDALDALEVELDAEGLEALSRRWVDLARPRRHEVAAALNRLRSLRILRTPQIR